MRLKCMRFLKLLAHIIAILFLTTLTQVGGIIWLLTILIAKNKDWKKRYVFPIVYLIFNLLLIPPIAKQFGRERLPWFHDDLVPRNWFYPLTFRNYVNPELKQMLLESTKNCEFKITYLDACFPFYNGFPLLPHLSHNDGKKVDLSFMYLNKDGKPTEQKPSNSGYGAFIKDANIPCTDNDHWQYDFPKYLSFGTNTDLQLDKKRTRTLLKALLSKSETQSIFIEPYLKRDLKLQNEYRMRFQGCHSVRHDDHIHLQIK